MKRLIDLSHEIRDGLVTYPGIPEPVISDALSREASRQRYAPGTEFLIGRIEMAGNTGTYLDTPFHRYPDGYDLADLELDRVAGVPVALVDAIGRTEIGPDVLDGLDVAGQAVLFHTGWSVHFGTPAYATGHPHLEPATAAVLVARSPAIVGIDSLNIDGTATGERAAHSALLAAGIPIVEHLRNLDTLAEALAEPGASGRFYAVPPKIRGFGTMSVRAFAVVK
ncbi:MAG TPA: cyclase family protein [Candidatus Limnocylindrales bacterium]|nr:cyclase family protein [Candidatus Limnocylindrales bacterium]